MRFVFFVSEFILSRRFRGLQMIAKWIKVRVKPDLRQEFLDAIEIDALGSERDEPGCARFNVLQDTADENVYYFYEVYQDNDAVDAHRAAPHYQAWKNAAHTLDGPVERVETRSMFPVDPGYWSK
jgi:quinol monooxygenase YgiN